MMVKRRKKRTTFPKCAQAAEAHGIEPLKDVPIFPMLRGAAVLFDELLYLVESGNDAFLARGAPALFLRLGEVVEFGAQLVQVEVTHSALHP
jgi:hypothetical protein